MTYEIQPFSQDPVLGFKTLGFACFSHLHFKTGLVDHKGCPTGHMHAGGEGLVGWSLPMLLLPRSSCLRNATVHREGWTWWAQGCQERTV